MTVPALELELAYRSCAQITRHAAANFYYGIRLLPREKRDAMSAVYAFARKIDDIGDESGERDVKLAQLDRARAQLATLGGDGYTAADAYATGNGYAAGNGYAPADPVTLALGDASARFRLPLDALELLIDAVEQDVRGTRYETFGELVTYCRGVAGSVGRLCLAIFTGGETDRHDRLADDLGVAMQLTNILRDVREDHEKGRLYLPAEDLRRFGCERVTQGSASAPPELSSELIRFEAQRARAWFDRGLELVHALDACSAACVLAMTGIYSSILDRITHEPDQVLRERISLPVWGKAWIAARSLAEAWT